MHASAADLCVLRVDDGTCFLDYVDQDSLDDAVSTVQDLLARSEESSVRDKALWLAKYLEYVAGKDGITRTAFSRLS